MIKIRGLMLKNNDKRRMDAARISMMLARQKFNTNGRDLTARTIIRITIRAAITFTLSAKIKKMDATNKSNTPRILTNINLKSIACFKIL